MRNLWVRIGIGAGLIFAVGMLFITVGRQVKAQVASAIEHGGRVPIPLSMLPMQVDASRIGQIKRLDVSRDASGTRTIHVVASVKGEVDQAWLAGCLLQADGDNVGGGFFSCVPVGADQAASLVEIGSVTFEPGDLTRPIVVRPEVARQVLRHAGTGEFNMVSDGQGTRMQVTDAQGRKVVQLQAGGNGASLRVQDQNGREVVRMQAGAGGVDIKVKADSQP